MLERFVQFSTAISSIYQSIQKLEREEMKRFGLKAAHVQCLLAVEQATGEITAAQLTELCRKDKAAISRTLSQLVEKGLLLRQSSYRAKLTLSPAGEAVARQIRAKAEAAVNLAGGSLTDHDREQLYSTLDQIAAGLQEMCRHGITTEP